MAEGMAGDAGSRDTQRTLWCGELAFWMDEAYLTSAFAAVSAPVTKAKVMRNKQTNYSEGYAFLEFENREGAEKAMASLAGTMMPQANPPQPFKLNWASFGIGEKPSDATGTEGVNEFSVFVGDLAPEVNDFVLLETFRSRYGSARAAKVMTDPANGRSKGFGFVRFGSEPERDRALAEMNGQYCASRAMRISLATPKKSGAAGPAATSAFPVAATLGPGPYQGGWEEGNPDPRNTTVFVGGLDPTVNEDDLRRAFQLFGELIYVKVPPGKGCGFVQYVHRPCAEAALMQMQGQYVGKQPVRLSWGRSAGRGGAGGSSGGAPPGGGPPAGYSYPGYAYPNYGYQPYAYPPPYGYDPYAGYAYAAAAAATNPAYAHGYGGGAVGQGGASMSSTGMVLKTTESGKLVLPNGKPDVRSMNAAYITYHHPMMMGPNMFIQHTMVPMMTMPAQGQQHRNNKAASAVGASAGAGITAA